MNRTAEVNRTTGETEISLRLRLDGTGQGERTTGVGFFDHMLDAVARHGRLDLDVEARGDLQTGAHHTVEDVGLVLGQALDEALGDRAGIIRYGHAVVPMDESRASAAIDISGRPLAVFEGEFPAQAVGDLDAGLCEEFLRAVASTAKLTLHVRVETAGGNDHHVVEAAFKAFARALREAVAIDPTETGVPSTKGLL
ncbi:MAG: imidazoleglycerol-phosphate dehydratase [Thermoleophilaceae bacterium]|jgi:imidazoleglycerol-phosphate dehydratase|nr:imidazoleglycerol-phosphate dehydratase [Thermoleophilaceae bacterium]MEA2469264.1 imidazoleglycerol-phosphate dehydratase [Thermoleophilaceae bacterium]